MVDKRIDVLEKKICKLDKGSDFEPGEIISRQTLITDRNKLEEEIELISMITFNFSK